MRRSVQYSGVAAVVVIWTTLLAATAVVRFDLLGKEPLSYLGAHPRSTVLFTLALAVSAVLLIAFHRYVRGRFPVSCGFSAAMITGLVGQTVAAFVPIGGEPAAHRVHTTSALVLGASLPLLMWRFAAGQPRGRWRQLSYALFWAEVGACITGLWLSARMVAPLGEILPGAVFHTWVVIVTFGGTGALTEPYRDLPLRTSAGRRLGRPFPLGRNAVVLPPLALRARPTLPDWCGLPGRATAREARPVRVERHPGDAVQGAPRHLCATRAGRPRGGR